MVTFCLFLMFVLLFVFLFRVFFFLLSFLCPFLATMSFAGDFLVRCLLSVFPAFLRACSRCDLVRFRPSYDHGWICSRLVNVI